MDGRQRELVHFLEIFVPEIVGLSIVFLSTLQSLAQGGLSVILFVYPRGLLFDHPDQIKELAGDYVCARTQVSVVEVRLLTLVDTVPSIVILYVAMQANLSDHYQKQVELSMGQDPQTDYTSLEKEYYHTHDDSSRDYVGFVQASHCSNYLDRRSIDIVHFSVNLDRGVSVIPAYQVHPRD
jgi:hypothetical protein